MSDWLPAWKPTSESRLEAAEKVILSCKLLLHSLLENMTKSIVVYWLSFLLSLSLPALTSEYRDMYVPVGEDAVIRCLVMEPQQPSLPEKTPLVMVHGFGCGLVQFYRNLDHLHCDRRLYALDLPGFARSTRTPFPEEAEAVEAAFVSALERWREGVGVERMVLLGHSLGGFLTLSYAMTHPHRVRHLILDDPWGLVDPLADEELREKFSILVRGIFHIATKFKPFDWIRGSGPLGEREGEREREREGERGRVCVLCVVCVCVYAIYGLASGDQH